MIPEAATSILALFAGMMQLHGKKLARIDGILHLQIQDLKKRPTYPLGLMYVQFTSCAQGVAGKG